MWRTKRHLHSKADDLLCMERKSFRSVSPLCCSAVCDHATNPRFHSTSSQQPEPVQSPDPPQPVVTKLESDSVSGGSGAGRSHRDVTLIKSKEKKPTSISGFKSSGSVTSTLPGKKPIIPTSSLIYQDADVGVDLGSMRRAAGHGTEFVKPADVDAPLRPPRSPRKPTVLHVIESDGDRVEDRKRVAGDPDNPAQNTDDPEDSSRKKRKR